MNVGRFLRTGGGWENKDLTLRNVDVATDRERMLQHFSDKERLGLKQEESQVYGKSSSNSELSPVGQQVLTCVVMHNGASY
jgi:hypothetical protein